MAFWKSVITSLKAAFLTLETVKLFSDGSVAEFKNKFTFSNLCYFKNYIGEMGEWSLFATSHRKGIVDGIGGMLKFKVWTIVKSRKLVVNSAIFFFSVC